EIELGVERGVDGVLRVDEQERVAVRRRTHHRFGGDVAGGAGPHVDDELLAEFLAQRLGDQPRRDVGRAAGGLADDDMHRTRRVALRLGHASGERQRGGAAGETEKGATWKAHASTPAAIATNIGPPAWGDFAAAGR